MSSDVKVLCAKIYTCFFTQAEVNKILAKAVADKAGIDVDSVSINVGRHGNDWTWLVELTEDLDDAEPDVEMAA